MLKLLRNIKKWIKSSFDKLLKKVGIKKKDFFKKYRKTSNIKMWFDNLLKKIGIKKYTKPEKNFDSPVYSDKEREFFKTSLDDILGHGI